MATPTLDHSQWVSHPVALELIDNRRTTTRFRHEFTAEAGLAEIAVTALGVVEVFLNGVRVSHDELVPGFTEYHERLQVFRWPVELRSGANVIEAELSDGWYAGSVGMFRARAQWGERTALRLELSWTDPTGTHTIGTDTVWCSRPTAHTADMIHGETLDLTAAAEPWASVEVIDGPECWVEVEAEPVRIVRRIAPKAITQTPLGWLVDFGENIAGGISLDALGPAGNQLRFVYGEALDTRGELTQRNFTPDVPFLPHPLEAGAIDEVISAGDDTEFLPRHSTKGFRYLRVEGELDRASIERIRACVFHSDLPEVGRFAAADDDFVWPEAASRRSLLGNAIDIPTDCPTRERAGWTADWDVYFPTASYQVDVRRFTRKWLRDVAAGQWANGVVGNTAPMPPVEGEGSRIDFMNGSAGWADSIVSIPWTHYSRYGDASILAEFWPNMERWLSYVTAAAEGQRHESRVAGSAEPAPHERYLWDTGFHFGEWFEPDSAGVDLGALKSADHGPTATAFYRRTTAQMAEIARVLGDDVRAAELAERSEQIRQAWRIEFLDESGRLISATQANCVRALAFNLLDEPERQVIADQLAELVEAAGGHLGTGFLATPFLLPVLADTGHLDLAYRVLRQRDWPSWLRMKDLGASTVWERWEGYDESGVPIESHNHYSKGAVSRFLYEYVAGLRRVPGRHDALVFAPRPPADLDWASAELQLDAGRAAIRWERVGRQLVVDLDVPAGIHAEFNAPDGRVTPLAAGTHTFTVESELS